MEYHISHSEGNQRVTLPCPRRFLENAIVAKFVEVKICGWMEDNFLERTTSFSFSAIKLDKTG
jgi:hypothetical protein